MVLKNNCKRTAKTCMEVFLKLVKSKYNKKDQKIIGSALEFARISHEGQTRVGSSSPYIIHPIAVAKNLIHLNMDSATIAAALLHDVVEDANVSEKTIEREFGKEVIFLVRGATKLNKIQYQGMERYVENLRKMFLAMAEDIRVVLIKLYDRLNNLETLYVFPTEKQERIAKESLEIYSPLAYRLGIGELRGQIEDMAFPYAYPQEYKWLIENTKEKYEERIKYLKKIQPIVLKELKKEGISPKNIHSRAKHHYSLYQKLLKFDMDFEKIYDLVALRIITDSENIEQCYKILGIIHKLWKPLPGLIKDYIALPKPNGYSSLHTTVFCVDGKITEFQIRTPKMHQEAEHGVAAHWAYVESGKPLEGGARIDEKKFGWIKELRGWRNKNKSPEEFMESLRIDYFKERVFVLTPKGDVIDLAEGSCPIDFAYHIHTDLGHRCQGAKINGKMVPLDRALKNWDVVDIISGKEKNPRGSWLYFVKTTIAKSRIKNWLKNQDKEENLKQGLEILNQALSQFKNTTWDKLPKDKKEELLKKFPYPDLQALIIAVGQGDTTPRQIIRGIFKEEEIFEQKKLKKEGIIKLTRIPIKIGGQRDLLIRMAKCCSPVPGEKICAYITKNRGAIVHRESCQILKEIKINSQERLTNAIWENEKETKFLLSVKIVAQDRIGLIKDTTSAITNAGINIFGIKGEPPKDGMASVFLKVEVLNIEEAEKVFLTLKSVKGVIETKRE